MVLLERSPAPNSDSVTNAAKTKSIKSSDHLIAGTAAGIVSTAAVYPLDLIKTRYQANDIGKSPYPSIRVAFSKIIKKDGWRSLYQGLGPALLGSGVSWGGYFYFYEMIKSSMRERISYDAKLGAVHHLTSGLLAGNLLVLLTNPIWLVKTRLQLQESTDLVVYGRRPYTGLRDAIVTIIREEGPLALYKGSFAAALLSMQGALQFTVYEWLKTRVPRDLQQNRPIESLLMGGSSKIFASVITYPYQVIKTRLQDRSQHTGSGTESAKRVNKYKNTFNCAKLIWQNEGLYGFFRGSIPYALRAAPASAITFVVYEEVMRYQKRGST